MSTTDNGVFVASIPASPQATYQSPGRTPERQPREKRQSSCSTVNSGSSVPTFVYKAPAADGSNSRTSSFFHSIAISEDTLQHQKKSSVVSSGPGTFNLILYLAITVPVLATLSFLYAIFTTPVLAIASASRATALKQNILAGHHQLFAVHASKMEIEAPTSTKNTLLLSLCSFPVSILVSMGGIFALASHLYSKLLSETDSHSSSLDRAMSFWFSYLNLFCADPLHTDDDDDLC